MEERTDLSCLVRATLLPIPQPESSNLHRHLHERVWGEARLLDEVGTESVERFRVKRKRRREVEKVRLGCAMKGEMKPEMNC